MGRMAGLKDRLRADLTAAMKARDEVRIRTLRMALTSIANEEVAGKQARDLGDDEAVLADYLPAQLSDAELASLVADVIAETGAEGIASVGQVMKAVTPRVAGRAEGGRVAAQVRAALAR
jgi:uncharacterized protein YqeY